jgi:hypothetical protein
MHFISVGEDGTERNLGVGVEHLKLDFKKLLRSTMDQRNVRISFHKLKNEKFQKHFAPKWPAIFMTTFSKF